MSQTDLKLMKFETLILNDEIRNTLPGKTIKLAKGSTYYEIIETAEIQSKPIAEKNWVVLVHGFSTPSFVWDNQVEPLKKAGYSVLRFDLFGRGYSDRPKTIYNMNLFIEQIYELVSKLQIASSKFHIVGLSMGGEIVTVFTARYPHLIRTITLVDPAGLPTNLDKPPVFIFKIPGINKFINKILLKRTDNNFFKPENFPEYKSKFMQQMKYKGYSSAIKSSMLNMPMNRSEAEYLKVGALNIPKLLFWGEKDITIPYEVHNQVQKCILDIKFVSVEDCAHMPNYEKSDIFNRELLKFLNCINSH